MNAIRHRWPCFQLCTQPLIADVIVHILQFTFILLIFNADSANTTYSEEEERWEQVEEDRQRQEEEARWEQVEEDMMEYGRRREQQDEGRSHSAVLYVELMYRLDVVPKTGSISEANHIASAMGIV